MELEVELAAVQEMEPGRIDYMLFDQRNHEPRRNRYKLLTESVSEVAGERAPHRPRFASSWVPPLPAR